MNYYECLNCNTLTQGFMNNCPICNHTHNQISEDEYNEKLKDYSERQSIDEDISQDVFFVGIRKDPDINILRECRSVIAGLLDIAWEFGGHGLGEADFENHDVIKDAREQLTSLDKRINEIPN